MKPPARLRTSVHFKTQCLLGAAAVLGLGVGAVQAAGVTTKVEPGPAMPKTRFVSKPMASPDDPVLLEAEQIDYQQDNGLVIASGHVAVTQGDSILLADNVAYDQEGDLVIAQGNVSLLDPSGNVIFADEIELTNDMKEGIARQFKARFNDDSVIAAAWANKINENKTELFKMAYTPCKCNDDRTQKPISPMWRITARHALVDEEIQKIVYNDTLFSVYGVPVFYTPYFSHATPGADNKSGILIPEYQHNNNVGTIIKVPVYYAIAPNLDATITPIYTSDAGLVMAGEYRHKFDKGQMRLSGSITQVDNTTAAGDRTFGQKIQGNIDGTGAFKISPDSDWGFDIHRTTDDTYLRLYDFDQATLLTSKMYWQRFNLPGTNNRSYAAVTGLAFQGLTAQDNASKSPMALPLATFNYQSDPLAYNSRFLLDGNALVVYRADGAQSRRLSTTTGWKLPYITDDGQIIEFNTQLRADAYSVQDVLLESGNSFSGVTGRLVPQVSALWHYPLINRWDDSSLLIEPVVMMAVSPGGGNPEKIPNEDSGVPEFTDTNIFDPNRFAGYDRIENGLRISYGLRGQAQVLRNKYLDWLLGQNYRISNDRTFPFSNDLLGHYSDYVGKVGITSNPIALAYRFRLDQNTLSTKRDEIIASYSRLPLDASISYLSLNNDPVLADKKAVTGTATVNLTKEWSWNINGSKDLALHQITGAGTGLTFQNECAIISGTMVREFTRDRDLKPSTSFLFRISLKNLD